MKKLHLLALIGLVLAFSSCSTARFAPNFSADAASQGMVLLGPSALHYYLDEKNHSSLDDSLSFETQELLATIVTSNGLPLTRRVQLDSTEHAEAVAFVDYLHNKSKKTQMNCPIPTALDQLLEAEGERYGLLIFCEGMSRDKRGFAKAVTKSLLLGAAVAVLSMGTVRATGAVYSAYSGVYAVVLDSVTDRVVFYNFNEEEHSPLEVQEVFEQVEKLLKDLRK